MKLYSKLEFISLPAGTIYSRPDDIHFMNGLYCKTSTPDDFKNDWSYQNLLSEVGFPNGIDDGYEALLYVENLRDTFQEFEMDLECTGRDGMYNDSDKFIVWGKNDIIKLRDYLNNSLSIFDTNQRNKCTCGADHTLDLIMCSVCGKDK